MCSPGDHGWVIAGEIWPGQVLSFLRDNASRWRDVKARPRWLDRTGRRYCSGYLGCTLVRVFHLPISCPLLRPASRVAPNWLPLSLPDLGRMAMACRSCTTVFHRRCSNSFVSFSLPYALLFCCFFC